MLQRSNNRICFVALRQLRIIISWRLTFQSSIAAMSALVNAMHSDEMAALVRRVYNARCRCYNIFLKLAVGHKLAAAMFVSGVF